MALTLTLQERPCDPHTLDQARGLPLHPIVQRVLANRASKYGLVPAEIIDTGLEHLDSPMTLPDIDVAANRLADAVQEGEVIGLETDHDVDGVTSHAVLYKALTDYFGHPADRIRSYIGHRLKEGYGLSDSVCDRILGDSPCPTLVVTADNGSSDAPRITRLLNAGIETVVTDHHGLPAEGPPADAYACVSPARSDSAYPDPLIAGVMVSFLLLCVVRQRLIDRGYLPNNTPRLTALLDFVALGTVADCVSVSRSRNNRAVIQAGLGPINAGARPCWQAIRPHLGDVEKPLTSMDLGFGIGPRINAVGRMDDAMVGVRFLLSSTVADAAKWVDLLNQGNELRREVEAELKAEALEVGELQVAADWTVVQVLLTEGHAGVHGIVASRLVEAFGRPAICFSPKEGEPGIITGSARSIEGAHVRQAMQHVDQEHPGMLIKFGGHEGAGGVTLKESDFCTFEQAYEAAIQQQLEGMPLTPTLMTDGYINTQALDLDLMTHLEAIEPFGREFESPVFSAVFKVLDVKAMGKDKTHWRFTLLGNEGGTFQAVWFKSGTTAPLTPHCYWDIAFTPGMNRWRGQAKLQLVIKAAAEFKE